MSATIKVTRVSHMACDECGDHSISLREPNTVYLDAQCATAYIADPDLWCAFKDHGGTVTVPWTGDPWRR